MNAARQTTAAKTASAHGVAAAEIDVDCAFLALSTASRTDVVAAVARARGQRI